MSCGKKKEVTEEEKEERIKRRTVSIIMLRRLDNLLSKDITEKFHKGTRGYSLITKGIYASLTDLANMGHGRAGFWYLKNRTKVKKICRKLEKRI